jgi:alpha-L-fucosidase
MIFKFVLSSLFLLAAGILWHPLHADAPAEKETQEHKDARMAWWRDAKFGMFIHWGLYSQAGGYWNGKHVDGLGEWIMNNGKIPVNEYAKSAAQFDPVKFNADEWVALAKEAGMKYMVITAKHHEGFAMFHTKVDGYNIYDATPFKRDPMAELAAACRKQGMKFGFYYSQAQDWHHPGGATRGGSWDPAQIGSMDDYVNKVAVPQVRELVTNYGPLAEFWFDTPDNMTPDRARPIAEVLKLQPQMILDNRLGGGFGGDIATPEGRIPIDPNRDEDWETCMTINGTWGYRSDALNTVRSAASLIGDLTNTASKGGNYLLNIGPDGQGEIPAPEVASIKGMGVWMKVNSPSIYGTTASPFEKKPDWGRITAKPGKLYLIVFTWPTDGQLLLPISNKLTGAHLLADPRQNLSPMLTPGGIVFKLPATAPDPIASVIEVDYAGPLVMLPPPPIAQDADGTINLTVKDMLIRTNEKSGKRRTWTDGTEEKPTVDWSNTNDYMLWPVKVTKPGNFQVSMNRGYPDSRAGATIVFGTDEQSVTAVVEGTGKDWDIYKDYDMGTIKVTKPGVIDFTLKSTSSPHGICKLRTITLTPVP